MSQDMGHPHEETGSNCQVSDHYAEYISEHLDSLKKKCTNLTACIKKLLLDENPLNVLQGGNIKLKKICRLIYQPNDGSRITGYNISSQTEQCTDAEKNDIRDDINDHIQEHLQEAGAWKRLKQCRQSSIGDTNRGTPVNDICRLAIKKDEICNSYRDVHKTAETFFNNQIRDMRCHCQSLIKPADDHSHASVPIPALVGAGVGFLLLLLAFLGFCCYRRRRKYKKKKRSPNVIYLPAPGGGDGQPIYQEVYGDGGPIPQGGPPTLPIRYTPHPTALNRSGIQEEEPSYLEPIEVGSMYRPKLPARPSNHSNMAPSGYALAKSPGKFDLPPEYSERPPEDENSETANPYFDPLPSPPETPHESEEAPYELAPAVPMTGGDPDAKEGGPLADGDPYCKAGDLEDPDDLEDPEDPIAEKQALVTPGGVGEEEKEAIVKPDRKLGPVPAKRSKREDREAESQYFTLEEATANAHTEV